MSSEKSIGKECTGFDGNWGQLKLTIKHITNSINIWHISLLFIVNFELAVLLDDEASGFEVDALGDGVSADSKQNRIIFIR